MALRGSRSVRRPSLLGRSRAASSTAARRPGGRAGTASGRARPRACPWTSPILAPGAKWASAWRPSGHDEPRGDQRHLCLQDRHPVLDLGRRRVAVARRAGLDDVGDVDLTPAGARPRPAPRRAAGRRGRRTGGPARPRGARGLPDEHDVGVRVRPRRARSTWHASQISNPHPRWVRMCSWRSARPGIAVPTRPEASNPEGGVLDVMKRIPIALSLLASAAVAVPPPRASRQARHGHGKGPDVIPLPNGFAPEGIATGGGTRSSSAR